MKGAPNSINGDGEAVEEEVSMGKEVVKKTVTFVIGTQVSTDCKEMSVEKLP